MDRLERELGKMANRPLFKKTKYEKAMEFLHGPRSYHEDTRLPRVVRDLIYSEAQGMMQRKEERNVARAQRSVIAIQTDEGTSLEGKVMMVRVRTVNKKPGRAVNAGPPAVGRSSDTATITEIVEMKPGYAGPPAVGHSTHTGLAIQTVLTDDVLLSADSRPKSDDLDAKRRELEQKCQVERRRHWAKREKEEKVYRQMKEGWKQLHRSPFQGEEASSFGNSSFGDTSMFFRAPMGYSMAGTFEDQMELVKKLNDQRERNKIQGDWALRNKNRRDMAPEA